MKDWFFQIPLNKKSTDLCSFITPFGKYKFPRLPVCLSISLEVFQKVKENIFGDLNIWTNFDDYKIAGETENIMKL